MLEVTNLHAHYGSSHIIQGVDLAVGPGEMLGIFGRNGVGKTTLLKTVAGWIAPTAGDIRIDRQQVGGATPDHICRLGLGFVPEDRRIFPGLTVEENLALGWMQAPRRSRAANREAMDRVYRRFPRLHERRHQAGNTLSGGEQQMLAMARVMVGETKILLVDEPSEGLAPMIVADLYAILRDMKEAGAAILLVEQNIAQALTLCDRFVAMERGQLVFKGNAKQQTDCDKLLSIMAV